jgi:hypothetical protein
VIVEKYSLHILIVVTLIFNISLIIHCIQNVFIKIKYFIMICFISKDS